MSMLGLRDLFLIAPNPPSLHHHHQQQQQHQQQQTQNDHSTLHPLPSSASLSVGLGIFPLLTATPCVPNDLPHDSTDHNHHNTTTSSNPNNFWGLKMCPEVPNHPSKKGVIDDDAEEGEGHNGIFGADFRVCQDCGNRAKKDCGYRRCRTCCKGRGYDCSTHLKSTWVPAARRRERQINVLASSASPSASKRLRPFGSSHNANAVAATSHSSASNATTPRSLDTTSCHQDASFKQSLPGHVRAPAVFRCHRVSAVGNGEDELAYMATVHISGHVFKGFLYDQGSDGKSTIPCASELQLGNYSSEKNRECSPPIGFIPTNNNNNAYPASGC